MSTRTPEQFVLPGFSEGPSMDTTPAAEALARYEARCRGEVAALVVEARTYGLSLEQVLELVPQSGRSNQRRNAT